MPTSDGRSYTIHEDTLNEAADLVEALANLNHLTTVDAHNPAAIGIWAAESEKCIRKLGRLLQSVPRIDSRTLPDTDSV